MATLVTFAQWVIPPLPALFLVKSENLQPTDFNFLVGH